MPPSQESEVGLRCQNEDRLNSSAVSLEEKICLGYTPIPDRTGAGGHGDEPTPIPPRTKRHTSTSTSGRKTNASENEPHASPCPTSRPLAFSSAEPYPSAGSRQPPSSSPDKDSRAAGASHSPVSLNPAPAETLSNTRRPQLLPPHQKHGVSTKRACSLHGRPATTSRQRPTRSHHFSLCRWTSPTQF